MTNAAARAAAFAFNTEPTPFALSVAQRSRRARSAARHVSRALRCPRATLHG